MAAQALYLRWRPMTFEDVVGQEHVTATLRNALTGGRIAHAYLFSGPRGTGKTTTARLLAKAANCLNDDPALRPDNLCPHCLAVNEGRFLDMIEIDAASHTGVDDVRDLRDRIAFAPNEGRYKVYIIDEVHRFSGAAFDALLKTIEEPPAHAIFVLATTEFHKVPQTILSRCQRFEFRRIALNRVIERLQLMVDAEGIEAEDSALELIARYGTGSLRDSISLLDQLITGPGDVLTLDMVQAVLGTVADAAAQSLLDMIIAGNTAGGLELINLVMDEGGDPRQFAGQVVAQLRHVMLVQAGGAGTVQTFISPDALAVAQAQAGHLPRRALLAALDAFNQAANDRYSGWQPQLPLELAFLKSIEVVHAPQEATVPPPAPASVAPPPSPAPRRRKETAAPPPAAEPQPDSEPASGALTLKELSARWDEIKKLVKKHDLAVEALLKSGHLHSVEGDTVIMHMPSQILRERLESDQRREVVERVFEQLFGLPLKLRCQVGSAQGGKVSPADDLLAEDSVASYMVNELGGKVSRVEQDEE